MTGVMWPALPRLGGPDGLLQESGGFHLGSFAKLLNQDEAERHDGGARERPAQTRILPRREETRQASKPGLRGQFGAQFRIGACEIQAAPWFRRGRQAGRKYILAIAHAFADRGFEFFHLGAALPA